MKPAGELYVGDIIASPLFEREPKSNKLVPEKKGVARRVALVIPRTGLTRVWTREKDKPNVRAVWELDSLMPLAVTR